MQTPRPPRRLFPSVVPSVAITLATLSVAVALVAGCSSGSKQSGAPLPDPSTLLKQSSQTTKNVKSVHLVMSTSGSVKGLPVKQLTGDLTTVPSTAAQGNAQISFGGTDIAAQFVIYDNVLYAALTPNKWSNFGPASDIYDPSVILNPDTGLSNMLAKITDGKAEGRENINGQDTIRITGKVPADAVNHVVPQLNATDALPVTVWVQESGDHQLVQAKLEQSSDNTIQLALSNWGEPVQVSKPPTS